MHHINSETSLSRELHLHSQQYTVNNLFVGNLLAQININTGLQLLVLPSGLNRQTNLQFYAVGSSSLFQLFDTCFSTSNLYSGSFLYFGYLVLLSTSCNLGDE